jgi:diaminopimelate epimerase
MEGAGNDFMVVEALKERFALKPAEIAQLADRHFGIGFDQLLVIEPPRTSGTDFYYRIFNQDGGEVEQCGNGARCFVRYVHERGLTASRSIRVETASGIIEPRLEGDGQVTVDMGVPRFEPAQIPFVASRRSITYALEMDNGTVEIGALSMGNPHAVQVVPDVEQAPVSSEGPKIEHHPRFPQRVNAGYMQILNPHGVLLRVWERGAGETLACGTGACAAAVHGIQRGLLQSPVEVQARGGMLRIGWDGEGEPVRMTGPARTVFEGEIEIGKNDRR